MLGSQGFVRNSARCEFLANRQAQIDDFADMVNGQCAVVFFGDVPLSILVSFSSCIVKKHREMGGGLL